MEAKLKKAAIRFKARYDIAKAAATGSNINCPVCNKVHVKTTYHKVFCSNQKTRRGGNCKDHYWNVADDVRRLKTLLRFKQKVTDADLVQLKSFLNW